MFVSAPDQLSAQLQQVIEGLVDGILILTELGAWIHANTPARRICRELTPETGSDRVPPAIWRVCESLIESRELFPHRKIVLESEVITPAGVVLRIRAQWLELPTSRCPYLLVVLEDRYLVAQHLETFNTRKYHLTHRQAQVWSLRQAGHSYQTIADRLYITLNTVKKHIKDVHAKIKEVKAWEEAECN